MFKTSDLMAKVDYEKVVEEVAGRLFFDPDIRKEVKRNILRKGMDSVDVVNGRKKVFREWVNDVIVNDVAKKIGRDLMKSIIENVEVSVDDVLKVADMYGDEGDRSVEALKVFLIKKIGVDEKAKEYWIKYMGDYGKMLVEDYKEKAKRVKLACKDLILLRDFFERNFGGGCRAGEVLKVAMGYGVGKSLYGLEKESELSKLVGSDGSNDSVYISIDVIDDVISRKGSVTDRSGEVVREVLRNVVKNAVDEKAKKYWIKYLGEYGEKLVREYKDLLKRKKVSAKMLRDLHKAVARVYGIKSEGASIIREILDRSKKEE